MKETGVGEGHVLGRYELLLRVAQGGMARVWAARLHGTRGFRKLVAVKTILPGVMNGERLEQMFLEEATLASGIHHPNVVDTLELGEQDGVMYMALEWVDGEPLSLVMSEAAKKGGIPRPIAVNLIGQACKGLHAAHELTDDSGAPLGLVHRDISPHNILVTYGGIAKLLDFGVAKATQRASSELTEAGEVKGKLAYMAPEQIAGRPVDRRTDIFALGTILYALTTGRHPWRGEHPGATTERLVSPRPAKPPSSICPDYPPALETVVLKALHKEPEQRFASAQEFLAALEEAVPSSLEGNSEARVAEFMKELMGPRGMERRKQIRLAGELLDQRRALTGVTMTGTGGSTSAVMVDADALSRANHSSIGAGPASQTPEVRKARRRLDKIVWAAIAAVSVGIGFAATRINDGSEAASDQSVRVPAASAPATTVELARPSVPEPAVTAAPAPAPAASDFPESEPKRKPGKSASGAPRTSRPYVPPAVPAAPSTPAAPPVEAAPSAAVAAAAKPAASTPATSPPASANAWNPKTFGNRY